MQQSLIVVDNAAITACDFNTGLIQSVLRPCKSLKNAVCLVEGQVVVGAQSDKASVNLWTWRKEQPVHKIICSEKFCTVAAANGGAFLAAATEHGRVFVWDWPSGDLLRVFDAHFKRVTQMKFTADDQFLLTAGEDAIVHVWSVDGIVSEPVPVQARYTWSDHTLPVTDIVCSHVGNRVMTASMDRTCKLWDLQSGQLLCTFILPAACLTLAWYPDETAAFVGTANGLVYRIRLYTPFAIEQKSELNVEQQLHGQQSEMVDESAFVKDVLYVANDSHTADIFPETDGAPVEAIAISLDGTKLVTGSAKGTVTIWDMDSRQPLRTLPTFKGSIQQLMIHVRHTDTNTSSLMTHMYPQTLSRLPILLDTGSTSTDACSRWLKFDLTRRVTSHDDDSDDGEMETATSAISAPLSTQTLTAHQGQPEQLVQQMSAQYQRLKDLNEEMYRQLSRHLGNHEDSVGQ